MKYKALSALLALTAAACSQSETAPPPVTEASPITAPAGEYRLDREHATLVFRINHLGFSWYTGAFSDFDATLQFDPDAPEEMSVEAVIKVPSLTIPAPREGFHETLLGPEWLKANAFPEMTFRSKKITLTGERTAQIEGDFTMLGVTQPVTLAAEFIGGYPGFHPHDPQARIGFSVNGAITRSDFGMDQFIPSDAAPGLSDEITFRIDAEFLGPPTPRASAQ